MSLLSTVQDVDAKIAKGNLVDAANEYYDKSVVAHVQNLVALKGKAAVKNLQRIEEIIGAEGRVEVIANRALDADNTSVSLLSFEGDPEQEERFKLLTLIARRWSEAGKILAEEYLPVRSAADAQTYFPESRLGSKQVQPRLSFVTPTRKRRGKGGGRPRKPILDTDLHRLPSVGKSVLEGFRQAGIDTFATLSKASDEVLQSISEVSGIRFKNFPFAYWREAAAYAVRGEWDEMPPPPRVAKKSGKREANVDFSTLSDTQIDYLPKVGPNLMKVFEANGVRTFADLAALSDEQLEKIRGEAGRPFVNFDMSYFRSAAQKKLGGAKSIPPPPKPNAKASTPGRRGGRKPRPVNPNDLHILPGVGAQLVKALHNRDIYTFADLAGADKEVLSDARAQTKGKYKNINLAYLRKQAKHAERERFDKIDPEVKIDKTAPVSKASAKERLVERLTGAAETDLQLLPTVGPSILKAFREAGISTFAQLADAAEDTLQNIADSGGKRFARFPISFWKEIAGYAQAGEFDKIPLKAPVVPKPKSPGRGRRGKRSAPTYSAPRDNKDLGALPAVGKTIVAALHEAGVNTLAQLAGASTSKLEEVRDSAGPRFKNFDVEYWKTVAQLAKDGRHEEYPPVPKKEKPVRGSRRGRAPKAVEPTQLEKLALVGPSMADALRSNGISTFQEIVDAENWLILKAASEAGKRFANLDPELLKGIARDATQGKFTKPERKKKDALPEGADKLSALPMIGAKVQERLFERGITTYSKLAKAPIAELESVRDQVRGRVAKSNVRDWKDLGRLAAAGDWEGVDNFGAGTSKAKATAPKRPAKPSDGDDLTKIKGIGPQAQQFFRTRGVKTYEAVAAQEDAALQHLLEEANARVKPEDFDKVRKSALKLIEKRDGKAAKKSKAAKK